MFESSGDKTFVALVRSYVYNLESFCSFSYSALFKKVMGFYIYSHIKIICPLVLGIVLYENDRYARWKQSGQTVSFPRVSLCHRHVS